MYNKLKIKRRKEKKIIWSRFRQYIDFTILACCFVIAINIHPSKITSTNDDSQNEQKMLYVFHDYAWNEYIMNDSIHGAPNSRDYLLNDEIPENIKWNEETNDTFYTWNDNNSVKDNQTPTNEIINDIWLDSKSWESTNITSNSNSGILIINLWEYELNDPKYTAQEENNHNNSSLIIRRINNNLNDNDSNNDDKNKDDNDERLYTGKLFSFIDEGRTLPTLVSRNDLYFENSENSIGYTENISDNSQNNQSNNSETSKWWITIISEYEDCMTPRWYKISHWDSILAYKQMDDVPGVCNIERRFCWKWKLSGTYTQQWCAIEKNYTYEQRWNNETSSSTNNEKNNWNSSKNNWSTQQNNNSSSTNKKIWQSSYIIEGPNNTYTNIIAGDDNIRPEEPEVEQTTRPYRNCTAPRGEKVKHWQFVLAFKHANWFSDSPCEMQIRLCSMWELMWTYTESTCKTRDSSFIDRVNGSPTWDTYSKEKIEWVKKQIENEKIYYDKTRKNAERSTNSDALDKILYILDQD